MSDPINLNNSSPGGFNQPTQSVENALTPAAQTLPKTTATALQVAGGGVASTPVVAGGSMSTPPLTMGTTPDQGCCSAGEGGGGGGGGGGADTGNWRFAGNDAYNVTPGAPLTIGASSNVSIISVAPSTGEFDIGTTAVPAYARFQTTVADWKLGAVSVGAGPPNQMLTSLGPVDPAGNLVWLDWLAGFQNTAAPQLDWVRRFGWNVALGGGPQNPTYPAISDEWEGWYQPGPVAQFERHIAVYGLNSITYRPVSILATWDNTPRISNLLEGNEVGGNGGVGISGLTNQGGGTIGANSTDARMTSSLGAHQLIVANSQALLWAPGSIQRVAVVSGDGLYFGGNIHLDSDTQTFGGPIGRLVTLFTQSLDSGASNLVFNYNNGNTVGNIGPLGLVVTGNLATSGGGGGLTLGQGSAVAVSPALSCTLRYNEGTNKLQISKNGAAYIDII